MASGATEALRDLRRARRRRAYGAIDWIDAVYRVYVTALLSALATSLVSGWIGGRAVRPAELARVLAHGPAAVGLGVAVVVAAGLRSGGRGGPLVLLGADVVLVLLAPVRRGAALRGVAARQLRFSGFAGGVAGMVAGNLAAQRLPGSYAAWVAAGGAAGVIAGLAFTGAALLASGLRAGRRAAAVAAAATVGWSLADLAASTATSPATFVGRLAMAPVPGLGAPAVGAALLALPVAGLAVVGGTSLEAARRQAGLLAQLRFAVTMQDVRTVILLRRQLAAEGPRRRPWLRLAAGGRRPGSVVWRRDWQGVLRWPGVRLARLIALGAIAGVAGAWAWRGTPALIAVAGAALLVAALDAVEGLAQEADHPVREGMVPLATGALVIRHLAVPAAVMMVVAGVSVAVAGGLSGGALPAVLAVGLVIAVPAALAAVSGAALSIELGPAVNPLEVGPLANAKVFARSFGPVVLAVGGALPVLGARAAVDAGQSAVSGAVPSAVVVLGVATAVAAWLRRGG
jgi:hypothetical protein